jgi:hypothetical protein
LIDHPGSGFVPTNPESKNVSGFKSLFHKPLEKKVVLTNSELKEFQKDGFQGLYVQTLRYKDRLDELATRLAKITGVVEYSRRRTSLGIA